MYRFRIYSQIISCGRERMGERTAHAEPGQSPQRQRRDACGRRAGPPARGRGPSYRDQYQCPTQTADHAGALAKTPTATAGAAPATRQAAGEPVAACVPVPSSIRRAQPHATSCRAIPLPVSIAENLIYHALLSGCRAHITTVKYWCVVPFPHTRVLSSHHSTCVNWRKKECSPSWCMWATTIRLENRVCQDVLL
jgi:hypothetical protein